MKRRGRSFLEDCIHLANLTDDTLEEELSNLACFTYRSSFILANGGTGRREGSVCDLKLQRDMYLQEVKRAYIYLAEISAPLSTFEFSGSLVSQYENGLVLNLIHVSISPIQDTVILYLQVHALKNIYSISRHPEFRYKTEFQSHELEFDYLKSLEIEEKINKIRWCQIANGALFLLSTNDKTIKFWKVQENKVKKIVEMNVDPSLKTMGNGSIASSSNLSNPKPSLENGGYPDSDRSFNYLSSDFSFPPGGIPSLRLPVVVSSHETSLVARCRRVYAHAHDYHINSISNNSFYLWDINMDSGPVATYQVHEYLRPKVRFLWLDKG
ncbi:serine/threonine protein phosphatase 2A 55 kDa regulatory subunit B alpha isoform-like [Vicia villosa]|uniref:serine/threonine protein phosphatase 2A 55 kDa regulatory subunit B alpha isoform-like n=1 Tax=Vicia villosa TaxID=3911 RepID=UPI00273C0ABB|nr:serine/threonine protein phosphatase 2A 55 kDa regulatory subunit B alpha isoform-like [Vicia villosa]